MNEMTGTELEVLIFCALMQSSFLLLVNKPCRPCVLACLKRIVKKKKKSYYLKVYSHATPV